MAKTARVGWAKLTLWLRVQTRPKTAFVPMECLQENQWSLFKHNGSDLRVRSACWNTKLVQTRRSFKETNKTYQNTKVGWASRRARRPKHGYARLIVGVRDNASDDDSLRVPLREWASRVREKQECGFARDWWAREVLAFEFVNLSKTTTSVNKTDVNRIINIGFHKTDVTYVMLTSVFTKPMLTTSC